MAGVNSSEFSESTPPNQDTLDNPGIGIVASETRSDAVMRTILRAREVGYDVLVVFRGTPRMEVRDLVDRLDATIVGTDLGDEALDVAERRLKQAALNRGLPGIIFHSRVAEYIDYDRSLDRLDESSTYGVTAVTQSLGDRDEFVVAGIPAYNEEVAISSVVHGAFNYVDEVVVVDDGSHDDTATLAREAGATVIAHETNHGKGRAMNTLFEYVTSIRCDVLVVLDGDGQHFPRDIPAVVGPILDGDADMVIGSRYVGQPDEGETPLYRRFGQRVLDLLTQVSSSVSVSDSQSGFRSFSPAALDTITVTTDGIGVETEMLDDAARNDLRIVERPIDIRYDDIDGQTYNPIHHGLTVVTLVVQLVRDRNPLLFFGVPGIALTIVGSLYGINAILIYQQTGTFYAAKVLVAGFLTIPGIIGVFCGLVLTSIQQMLARIEGVAQ